MHSLCIACSIFNEYTSICQFKKQGLLARSKNIKGHQVFTNEVFELLL